MSAARALAPGLALGLLLVLAGCDEDPESRPVDCGFGESHLLAQAEGPLFDDLALVPDGDRLTLLYSDRSGLYSQALGPHGAPVGERARLGAACPGGVAGAAGPHGLVVACVQPADPDRGREGALVLLSVARGAAHLLARAEPVGAQSRGVDVAVDAARVVVGWRDADVFTARARTAVLRGRTLEEPESLSSLGTLASAPSLEIIDGRLVSAWTESWFDRNGAPSGHLLVQREGDPPMPSLEVSDVDVRVHLTADAHGPLVTLRDRRPARAAPRAFVARLDDRMRADLRGLHSPLRADSDEGRPMLVPCGEHLFAVATRNSSRGVTMVNIRRLDSELRSVGGEHQIYEYHTRFPQAVAACVDGKLIVAVGEQQSQVQPVPRLRTFELVCGPGRVHERTPAIEGQVLRERGAGPVNNNRINDN